MEAWIQQHAADAAAMGKPFMIEEFGKEVHLEKGAQANITSIRGPFYRKVYQQLQESLAADGALKGQQPKHLHHIYILAFSQQNIAYIVRKRFNFALCVGGPLGPKWGSTRVGPGKVLMCSASNRVDLSSDFLQVLYSTVVLG